MGTHGGLRTRGWATPWTRAGGASLAVALTVAVLMSLGSIGHAAEAALVPGTPCAPTAEACVDLYELEAWLIRDGVVTYGPVPISTGADGEETPAGVFRVDWKHADHISGESGVPMPFAVFFAPGGIAFHEGDVYGESAGCVRLGHEDARAFYNGLQVGDEVAVVSSEQ